MRGGKPSRSPLDARLLSYPVVHLVKRFPCGVAGGRAFLFERPARGCDARFVLEEREVGLDVELGAVERARERVAEILAAEPDAAPADNDDAWAVEVLPRADLAVALGAEPDPVPSGGELTYTVTVDNAGPSVATAVVVDHVLPNEAKVNGAPAGSGWTCTVATDAGVATVTCERPSLAAETSSTISVVVAAPLTPGTATSSAQVAAATEDSDLSNNVAERSVSVEEPLPATILLVDDDDDSPDVMSYYTAALDVLGFGYDIWDTGASDLEPDAATLSQYEVVIWFTGAHSGGFAGPGPAAESALGQYLDAGGCLFVSSQDYLWDRGGSTHDVPTPLMSDYLGMASGSSDVRHSTVTGSGADFGVLGSHTLAFPYSNFSDRISPDASAQLGWSGDQGDAGIAKSAGGYRTTFWGFGFEAVPTAVDREDVMAAVLLFCADVGGIFADGFESGNWSAWSSVVGGARTSPAGR